VPERGHDPHDVLASEIEQAQRYLSTVAARLRSTVGPDGHPPVVLTQACVGVPADRIVREAELWRTDAIVMSTHGRGGLDRLVHGSVADAVLRHSVVPVLLVPARTPDLRLEGEAIVLALDGSAFAEAALPYAAELARELACPMRLVIAVPWQPGPIEASGISYSLIHETVADAEHYLDGVIDQVRRGDIEARGEVVVGPAARTIQDAADDARAAAIVMATHGRGGLSRLAFGSVAAAVLEHTSHPLLLIHPMRGQPGVSRSSSLLGDAWDVPVAGGRVEIP
jgi:nucleotide-binding universal stress UspA family protein